MTRSIDGMLVLVMMAPAAAQAQVQPGQWEATTTIKSIDMPGGPPQVVQMMQGRNGTHHMSYCVTPEQAAKGPQEMLKQNPSCHFSKFSMVGGAISTEMTCAQNGGTMTARSSGTYTPTSFNVTSSAEMTGRMSMRMTTVNSGHRVGPCTGK